MKPTVPSALNDPMIRETERIPHGETISIVELTMEVNRRRDAWLNAHPGWTFRATSLVRCEDGSLEPSYDVVLEFQRHRTPAETEAQMAEKIAWLAKKEAEYHRREVEQTGLLAEVLGSLEQKR